MKRFTERFVPRVIAAALALSTAGGCYQSVNAQETLSAPSGYDPKLPYSDARVGIQKRSPYLYRYDNDWQRNRNWRDRHDPLRNLPVIPPAPDPKPGSKADGAATRVDPDP